MISARESLMLQDLQILLFLSFRNERLDDEDNYEALVEMCW